MKKILFILLITVLTISCTDEPIRMVLDISQVESNSYTLTNDSTYFKVRLISSE